MLLKWRNVERWEEAMLGTPNDGVFFSLANYPTCYRRGPWKLMIEVCGGENHHKWGCFDEQDQPMRFYHDKECALREAEAIATVLLSDRSKEEKGGKKT